MGKPFSPFNAARAIGFAAGWAAFTLLLALATRPMGLGPGFSNLLPYAVAAILLSGSGHGVRSWLNQKPFPGPAVNRAFLPAFARAGLDGLKLFFSGTAAFNNFLFLSIAYFAGIGLTSLFTRAPGGKKPEAAATGSGEATASYWRDSRPAPEEADAYYRPF